MIIASIFLFHFFVLYCLKTKPVICSYQDAKGSFLNRDSPYWTAVCNGDQLLDFSAPELVRSQSTFGTDSEVLKNCAGLVVGERSAVMALTPCMLCVQIYCVSRVLDYYLLNSQYRIQDWVGLDYVLETSVQVC